MKKLIFAFILSLGTLHIWGQEIPDIDSVLNNLNTNTIKMNTVLSEYLPLYQEYMKFNNTNSLGIENNSELETRIIRDFRSVENFYSIIEFNRSVIFMYSSLNPDYNIKPILSKLEPFLRTGFKKGSPAAKVQIYCNNYLRNLELLSEVIHNYENVPYFCFQAYPKFSNKSIDENLAIINSRIDFEFEGMGYRTKKFLSIEEIDLSNSNFSMDLLFKDHKNIHKLNLANTKIHSIEYLADLNIEWLDLSNTNIDQRDLIYLRYMPSIYFLDLTNTNLSRMAITELRSYLMLSKKNCIFSRKGESEEESILVTEISGNTE
ncbi:MAG: hypothetical protein K9H49_12065 [Bacteroidales bacterium]|nr:hypothetical protein [Bacteroidales bacterium]MCF8392109.1 hypothetical protein [Bacteroidales bacterium]